MPVRYPPRAGIAPRGQLVPAPAHQGQVSDVAYPHLVGARGRGLAQQPVLGHHGGRVGLCSARALGAGADARCPLTRSQVRNA